jgi:hypothetical protein
MKYRGRPAKTPVTVQTVPIADDATPERIAQAAKSGLGTVHLEIRDASGFDTGSRRREVLGTIETLHGRNIINTIQYQAGSRFITLWATAARGPRITQRWDDTPRGNGNGDTDSERIERASRAYVMSWRAVSNACRPVLYWLIDTQTAETSPTLIDLGLKHQGAVGKEPARARGAMWLCMTLNELALHYGLTSRQTPGK